MSHLKFYFCVGAAFGSPQVTNIKTVARTAKGGPYNVKFKVIQRTTILLFCLFVVRTANRRPYKSPIYNIIQNK